MDKIKKITKYDPSKIPGHEAPLEFIRGLGNLWDSVGGAPTRAALEALQEGRNPASAFGAQFGEDPDEAPTAKQLVENDPTTAPYADTLLPTLVGASADVSNLALPGIAKLLGRAAPAAKATEAGAITDKNFSAAEQFLKDPGGTKFQHDLNPEVFKYKHGLLSDEKQAAMFQDTKEQLLKASVDNDPFSGKLNLTPEMTNSETLMLPAGLDMAPAARMGRAKEMGFDPDRTWFHGTAGDFESFDPKKLGSNIPSDAAKEGFFFSSDPNMANNYASLAGERKRVLEMSENAAGEAVVPSKLKMKNPLVRDFNENPDSDLMQTIIEAKDKGHDGVILKNAKNAEGETAVVFDPTQIRSKFAKFNPNDSDSGNMAAGLGGAVGAGLLADQEDDRFSSIRKLLNK